MDVAQCYIIYRSYTIQINVGQKDKENQWRVVDLEEFLYTALLYQAMTNRNTNAATSLKQKNNGRLLSWLVIVSV